jgi:Kef-type K+ transport system membrane component KefB
MESTHHIFIVLGCILLFSLGADYLGKRTFLPRVTLLLIFGMLIGKDLLDLIPPVFSNRFELIADSALIMVGFLLGGKLTRKTFKESGSKIIFISISAVVLTVLIVFFGLILIGVPIQVAILLGCIASATAPAATADIVGESGYTGPFADILLSVVALDDAWGLIVFSLGVAIVISMNNIGDTLTMPIVTMIREVGGAMVLGALVGWPAAYLTGRMRPGQPMLSEALGFVFICGGIAIWLEVSFLIASMIMGAVVANFAKHHEYPFHEIENVEWPFMVVFFVMAGASLQFSAVKEVGLLGFMYIACRISGKIMGAGIAGIIGRADKATKRWMGMALFPQAGVAIGMALVAANQFPEYRQVLLATVVGSTVFFEIIGPLCTRFALNQAQKNL